MKRQVKITRGIEPLFGTRDENIRLLESALQVSTHLLEDCLEIEGEPERVRRAEAILEDYVSLVQQGQAFTNGDMKNYLRVALEDPQVSLLNVVSSARQRNFGKKTLAPRSLNQLRYVEAIERNDMVFAVGPAGTGKTYLAVAMAVSALLSKRVGRIILARPAVEAGERLGFLPGTLQEKVDPYLRPLYDALFDMLEAEKVEKYLEKGLIEIAPLAFMRGRSLNDSFIILDEAQNSTPEQMKMFLTRLGFGSKAVITGDVTQIDLPAGKHSGLLQAIEVVSSVEGVSFIYLDERDVVRHTLVQRIIKAYEQHTQAVQGRQLSFALDPAAPAGLPAAETAEAVGPVERAEPAVAPDSPASEPLA
jgi:phosphate starvation-inducible PhoH-like protein